MAGEEEGRKLEKLQVIKSKDLPSSKLFLIRARICCCLNLIDWLLKVVVKKLEKMLETTLGQVSDK